MKLPTMTPVQSSNLAALGYDANGLFVAFRNGSTYRYPSVPREVYEGALEAPSVGSWFAGAIRGRYEGSKVNGEPDAE